MKKILFAAMLMCSAKAQAQDYKLLALEDFDVTYQEFKDRRDPYAPEYDNRWAFRASTNFNVGIMNTLYWHNNVHTEALDSGTVKTVGWHWIIGLRVSKYVDVFQEHHSQHIMEESRPRNEGRNTFPVENSYGIKFKIVEDGAKKKSLGGWLFK